MLDLTLFELFQHRMMSKTLDIHHLKSVQASVSKPKNATMKKRDRIQASSRLILVWDVNQKLI